MITDRRPFRTVDGRCDGNRNGGHRFQRCEQNIPEFGLPAHRERDTQIYRYQWGKPVDGDHARGVGQSDMINQCLR